MTHRIVEESGIGQGMLDRVMGGGEGAMSIDERLGMLARVRESGIMSPPDIDRYLVERVERMRASLSSVEEQHARLRELMEVLTSPPWFPAVFLAAADAGGVHGAIVQTGEDRRIVQVGEDVAADELRPGDEVYLTHERNCLIAKAESDSMTSGEVAAFSHALGDGRIVLRSHDQEIVVMEKPALREGGIKAGDGVRFNRATGMAYERIEPSKGNGYFLEATPRDSFLEIGGLENEIEQIKRLLTLHVFCGDVTAKYRLPRKRSVLFVGPPGNGKTKVARATANWLAGISPAGRSQVIHVKPSQLSSMWFGQTEERLRELFRIAREAAAEDAGVPVVMFWDEVDAIGATRGESVHRIDDRILNCFMAELDGLENRGNIVIMAATNRLDVLDPALLRPGRMGDLVLQFQQPKSKSARAILGCHLPPDIPYAADGTGQDAAREQLLDLAVAQLFAQNSETELANLTMRDGKHRLVRAADLVSGAHLEAIAQNAMERACVRETEGGPGGLNAADMDAAVNGFFLAAPRALTPRNARNYLHDLPHDVDVVSVEVAARKVRHPYRFRTEAA
jgi:proteasome-associated ATPase